MICSILRLFINLFLIFPTFASKTEYISRYLVPLSWKSIDYFFFYKLRQSKNLEIAISLSKIGQQIISRSIWSEIVPTFYVLLVYVQFYWNLRRNRNCGYENFFFEHTLGARFFFLFALYIRAIRSWTWSIKWYTFSRTTSYLLGKSQKSTFFQTSAI